MDAGHSHEHSHPGHDHSHSGHSHAPSASADRRWLSVALALIAGFMAVEVVAGLLAGSLALLSRRRAHAHRCRVDRPGAGRGAARRAPGVGRLTSGFATTLQVDHESWQPLVQIQPHGVP